MAWIDPKTYETASPEAQKLIDDNGKGLLNSAKVCLELNNAAVLQCVEINGWRMDDEIAKVLGKKIGDIFEYAISVGNKSFNCTRYFTKVIKERYGIDDLETADLTDRERLAVEFAFAVTKDFHNIPEDLKERMNKEFTQEEIVVLMGEAAVMTADNIIETLLDVR